MPTWSAWVIFCHRYSILVCKNTYTYTILMNSDWLEHTVELLLLFCSLSVYCCCQELLLISNLFHMNLMYVCFVSFVFLFIYSIQVLEERIHHIEYVPSTPEPYYQPTGRELQPRPVGEENGVIVYCYNPISAVNYVSIHCSHRSRQKK